MAETLELQQVVCPSCRRVITSFNPFLAEVECPYCHNKAFNPLITAQKVPVPERMIPFQSDEKEFEASMVAHLVAREHVPRDIFQCIGTGKVVKAYLPMFLFEGRYETSWSAQIAFDGAQVPLETGKSSVKTVGGYMPQTGTARGNFAFLCLAYKGNDIPEELRNFANRFPYRATASKAYDPTLLKEEGLTTLALNTDAEQVWSSKGERMVNEMGRDNAQGQLSGQDFKNFRCSTSYETKHGGRYVLAPFWFVYYTYNNEQHYFLMDGLGEYTAMSAPVDLQEEKFVMRKKRNRTIVAWLWPLIAIGYFFLGLERNLAIFLFILWAIIAIVTWNVAGSQIKRRLKASKEARKAGAAGL